MDQEQVDQIVGAVGESPRPVVDRIDRLIYETRKTRYAVNAVGLLLLAGMAVFGLLYASPCAHGA